MACGETALALYLVCLGTFPSGAVPDYPVGTVGTCLGAPSSGGTSKINK
jgi:hypothetical protein